MLRAIVRRLALASLVVILLVPAGAMAWPAPDSFADLAAKLLPAVVNISSTQTIKPDSGGGRGVGPDVPQFPPGSPFEEFFKDFFNNRDHGGSPQALPRHATSLGSGFIIDPSGLVVTNNHVIAGADAITVTLQDDINFKAEVVGRDTKIDVALLRIKAPKPLPFVKFGDSDKMRIGDWVLAIGNPFGLGGTVTAGIVSARAREINAGPYDDFIQTDAAINRGNSGGPLFNMDGEVIGIATAIYSPSGGSIGIGFAIPSSLARNIVDQLRAHGHIKRGWLGVRIQTVTDDIASSLGMDKARGALVASVTAGGPAAKAGVEPGDVIVAFNGKKVPEMHRLPLMVAETPVDKTVDMTVFRKGHDVTLNVKIGELKPSASAEANADNGNQTATVVPGQKIAGLGITVASLSDDLRTQYGIKKDVTGVIVTNVSSDGLAADQGIEAGDVVAEAGQQNLKSPGDLAAQVDDAKKNGKPLLLLINRKDDLEFVAITFPKASMAPKASKTPQDGQDSSDQ